MKRLTDGHGRIETTLRRITNTIGIDPYDVHLPTLRAHTRSTEQPPRSRFRFGSPCRFIRSIDFIVHCWLPTAMAERYPRTATRLAQTSPRWGRQP